MDAIALRPWVQALVEHQLWLVVGLIVLEMAWSAWRRRATHTVRITLSNASLALLHFGAYVLTTVGIVLPVLDAARVAFGVFDLPADGPLTWLLCLMGTDLCAYGLHRTQHHVRWFWVGHSVHHTAPEFNLTVGPRLGLLDTLDRIPFFLPLALLGFHAEMIVLCYALIELWSFWTHTSWIPRLRWMPWFEWLFNTPANHRLHHGRNTVYLDRNFGEFTMLWDHLFGTFVRYSEPVDYGATAMPPRQDPWTANVFELRRLWADMRAAPNWRTALATPWRGFQAPRGASVPARPRKGRLWPKIEGFDLPPFVPEPSMGNKIITEASRLATPRPAAPKGVTFTRGNGQKRSLERGSHTRSKKNAGKRCHKGG